MNKIFSIIVSIITLTTYAQTVKPLSSKSNDLGNSWNGIYYKDIDNNFLPFIGSWKYENGNNTFIITFSKITQKQFNFNGETYFSDIMYAHYSMYQNYGLSNQQLIYTSNTSIAGRNQFWDTIFVGKSTVSNKLTGIINDIALQNYNPNFPQGVEGMLSLTINPGTFPLTAQLHISKERELMTPGQPNTFVIPTNVILTKI